MSNCNLRVEDIIQKYMKYGWFKLTDIFHKKSIGKKKNLKLNVDDNLLKLLGSIRIFIIDNYFKCINNNKNTFCIAYGSTNITSDYDLTIVGKNANDIMYKMFFKFLNKYKNSLPFTFDTNLYSTGLYLSKSINKNIKQITKLDDNLSIILPFNKNDYIISLSIVCIKLLKLNFNMKLYPKLNKYFKFAQNYLNQLNEEYINMFNYIKKKYNKKYNKKCLNIITNIELYYNKNKKLYNILYGKNNSNNIIKYQTFSSFFANEAYYSCSTIAVVVYEIQANKKLKLNKNDYLIALIENLGDFNIHFKEEFKYTSKSIKSILLKYSKYIYRIYYCLSKLINNKKIINILKKIKNEIIPKRKNNNIKNIDFSLLHYNNENYLNYINKFNKFILNYIELFLNI